MEAIKDVLTAVALFGWLGLEGYAAYKLWRLGKRIDGILDELDEDLKNGY